MTNITERIRDGIAKAMGYLEDGDSVRKACKKAGISVTSLYLNTTQEQRDKAYLKNTSPASTGLQNRGKRRKVIKRRTAPSDSSDLSQLQRELEEKDSYIQKLERKLVQTIVLNEVTH
jgi:predicted RNase H-like nuclease (RuvC/YqgF family)